MYPENAEEQRRETETKIANYEKWLVNNPHASKREKRDAKWEVTMCNTFSRPNIPKKKYY